MSKCAQVKAASFHRISGKLFAGVCDIEVNYPKPEGLTGLFLFNIVAGCIEVNCQKPEGLRVALCYNIPPKLLRI